MIKRWKELSELECVKYFGIRHKIGHFLGVNAISKCGIVFGLKMTDELYRAFRE